MRLLGALGQNETPEAGELDDSLEALNDMLDGWSQNSLSVNQFTNVSVTWPANQATRTIGPTGDFVETRPSQVLRAEHLRSGVHYPIDILQYDRWLAIADRTVTSTLADRLYVEYTMPDAVLYLYPVPAEAATIKLYYEAPLSSFATVTTDVTLPPGYRRAITYSLAVELAAEFGRPVPAVVRSVQTQAMRSIQARNSRPLSARQGAVGLSRHGYGKYDIAGDTYR